MPSNGTNYVRLSVDHHSTVFENLKMIPLQITYFKYFIHKGIELNDNISNYDIKTQTISTIITITIEHTYTVNIPATKKCGGNPVSFASIATVSLFIYFRAHPILKQKFTKWHIYWTGREINMMKINQHFIVQDSLLLLLHERLHQILNKFYLQLQLSKGIENIWQCQNSSH